MIKFEHNTLVLDQSHTKADQQAINDFVEYKIREIIKETSGNKKTS
jgi:hypothetical protein